jgi:hypothetical protein
LKTPAALNAGEDLSVIGNAYRCCIVDFATSIEIANQAIQTV